MKYKKFYASKYEYPTRVVQASDGGVLLVGHKNARKDIEKKLGRVLHKDTKVKTRGGNWVFYEPVEKKEK